MSEMEFADANLVVRYLTNAPPDMAERAAKLIDSGVTLHVSGTVLLESAHALRALYKIPREPLIDNLVAFLQKDNIKIHQQAKEVVIAALLKCRPSGRISIGDALLWAAAVCSGPAIVHTFDRRFPSDGIEVREPR